MNCDICGEETPVRDLSSNTTRGTLARGAIKVCEWCYFSEKKKENE